MHLKSISIDGESLTTKITGRMEDTLQAFAVRAACFIGEQDKPYSEEFDGQDFGATHVVAYLGAEPVGTLRIRWFQSFAMPERLAVMQRFRGHGIGPHLLERARTVAESRGCKMLYTRVPPKLAAYFEQQGWRRLEGERSAGGRPVALVRPIDPASEDAKLGETDTVALSTQYQADTAASADPQR